MQHLFWDGRIQPDGHGGISTPAGSQVTPAMQRVFEFGSISAIAMFPVTNRLEMRGQSGNELAAIPDSDNPAIWAALMARLGAIPEYRQMFEAAYPGTQFSDMTFAHAANAIGGFIVDQFTFNNTPWDRFLAGNDRALTPAQLTGAQTFMTLKCSICHTGALLSDEKFHDVAVAQVGPGEGDGPSLRDDFGRMRVTGNPADQYLFRTTPLRNVELTGTLRPRRRHHLAPRVRRTLQRVGSQARGLRPHAARAGAARHAAAHRSGNPGAARHAAQGRGADHRSRGPTDGLHERAHRRRGAQPESNDPATGAEWTAGAAAAESLTAPPATTIAPSRAPNED